MAISINPAARLGNANNPRRNAHEQVAALPSLKPIQDTGMLTVIYAVPTWWTQAARPPPRFVLADGSLGDVDESLPLMGFMAQQHPEGPLASSITPGGHLVCLQRHVACARGQRVPQRSVSQNVCVHRGTGACITTSAHSQHTGGGFLAD